MNLSLSKKLRDEIVYFAYPNIQYEKAKFWNPNKPL
jgi:hypothetical protein